MAYSYQLDLLDDNPRIIDHIKNRVFFPMECLFSIPEKANDLYLAGFLHGASTALHNLDNMHTVTEEIREVQL